MVLANYYVYFGMNLAQRAFFVCQCSKTKETSLRRSNAKWDIKLFLENNPKNIYGISISNVFLICRACTGTSPGYSTFHI